MNTIDMLMADGTTARFKAGSTIRLHPRGWKQDPARRKQILTTRRVRQRNTESALRVSFPPSSWPYGYEGLKALKDLLRAKRERYFVSYRPRPWRVKVRFNTPGVGWTTIEQAVAP